MKPNLTIAAASLALTALFVSPAPAAEPARPDADAILREMSATITGARSFRFEAHRQIDPALLGERILPADAHVVVTVQHPNKIAARSTSKDDVREFYADGQTLSLLDVKKNFYATVPMRTSLDGLVAELDAKYGFTPPLAELALSNVYADIHWKARSISYVGEENVPGGFLGLGGTACHRIAISGSKIDAELWVGVNDHLPKKLVATAKARAGKPQIKVEFSGWNLAPSVTDHDFTFVPPKGATKITMSTAEDLKAPHKKKKH